MKLRIIIWPAVLVCCIILGVWQRHNISIFWREYHSLWRDYEFQKEYYTFVPRKHLIPESVARSAPEAAAVADMVLGYYEEDEQIPALAENLLKFPKNEFFLFSCVTRILRSNELDQGVAVKLTEKLIESDKDNSICHYLRAATLIGNEQDKAITSALDEIKTAANCQSFYFPYVKYSQRTINVAEKASLNVALMSALPSSHSFLYADTPRIRLISKFLLRHAHRAFTDGEDEKGLLIDDAINSIGRNQINAGHYEAGLLMAGKDLYMPSQFCRWSCPEILELQRANITEQRARQNRLQLCPHALPRIKSEETKDREDSGLNKKPEVTDEEAIIAVPVAVHNGRMLFAMAGVWLVLAAICMVRGRSGNQRVGITTLLSFAAASLCYFFVINWQFLGKLWEMHHCGFSPQYIMRPRPCWKQIADPDIHSFLFLICLVMASLLLWATNLTRTMSFWWKTLLKLILTIAVSAIAAALLGALMYLAEESIDLPECLQVFVFIFIFALPVALFASWFSKLRFVRVLLAAMPLGILTILLNPYAYISQIPMVLFVVICTLIVLNKPSESIPFMKALTGIFSSQPELAAIRSKAVKLLAVFLVIHWLIFTASVPTCAQSIEQSYSAMQYSYPKSTLAPADETSYQQVLARFDCNDFTLNKFYRLTKLIMPQDLPLVLSKCKKMSFDSPYPWRFPVEHKDVNIPLAESPRQEIKLRDYDIIEVMQGSGRDTVNILTDAMENPERESVLVIRAKLGDVRVKAKLEELLASRLANGEPPEPNGIYNYWDRPAKTADIICALACISEPNEAETRFLDYITRGDVSQLKRDDEFFRGIPLLPTTQAREVLNAYLAKAQDWQPPEQVRFDGEKYRDDLRETLSPVNEIVEVYDDRDISEAVLKIMLRSEDKDIMKLWWEPWEAPQDFDIQSADLLRQGLASKNEQLRAWCVWQLRKVGYQFGEDEMSRLLADESWKVRANAVIAGGRKTVERAAKDSNPFVRWVASLSDGEEN